VKSETKYLLEVIGREILLISPGIALLVCARGLTWLPFRSLPL
jgi:hypothetical protein